ncbi:hypothetical protein NQ317_002370 [Molorchus minor]|uniref:Uncharacterized protein n=1 Tax=Molorchus minor TaxID=1323400 RepID=A0ABQ9JVA8_9CUCU|nr:hypothetical protein NQ317_002370 [Molorchus minor]
MILEQLARKFYHNKSVILSEKQLENGRIHFPNAQSTASNCGTVIKRRSSTKPDNLVKTIMGINYAQSEAINYD